MPSSLCVGFFFSSTGFYHQAERTCLARSLKPLLSKVDSFFSSAFRTCIQMNFELRYNIAFVEAAMFALIYAFEARFRSLKLESDCLVLIRLLQTKAKEYSTSQIIVNDMCNFASSCNVCFLLHKTNLTQWLIPWLRPLSWLRLSYLDGGRPPEVRPVIVADKSTIE